MHIQELYNIFLQYPQVITDSRKIKKDSLFFALRGDNFNGNLFALQALEEGARYAVVDQRDLGDDERLILVDDVLQTLQDLAKKHRETLDIPFIGLTGTNGKTTSKELIHAVLGRKYKTHATKGNLNNHIGVPLTLLEIPLDAEIAIIEMGANHIGEIEFLCNIAQPTHGLITNIGKAHLEGFGSFEGVKKAKGELYEYLARHGGSIFVQGDNPFLAEMLSFQKADDRVVSTYGCDTHNSIVGRASRLTPLLEVEFRSQPDWPFENLKTQLTGSYNLDNILSAICVGTFFGVSLEDIRSGIENYSPSNQRSQILYSSTNRVIADYYNANPSSMLAALENIRAIEADTKAIILGDMFELGDDSDREHRLIVEKALSIDADRLIFVGKAFKQVERERAEFYATTDEAREALIEQPLTNSTVLLKGSRGMAFERLIDVL